MKFIAHATTNTENFAKMTTAKVGKISTVPNTDVITEVRQINISDYDGTYIDLISDLLEKSSKLNVCFDEEHITHFNIVGEGDKPFVFERVVTSSNNTIVTGFNNNDGDAYFGFQGTRGKMSELNNLSIPETFPFKTWEHYSTTGPVVIRELCENPCLYKCKGAKFSGHLEDLVDNGGNVYEWRNYTLDIKRSMLPWETQGDYIIRSKEFDPQGYSSYILEAMLRAATHDGHISFSQQLALDDYLASTDKREEFEEFASKIKEGMESLCPMTQ